MDDFRKRRGQRYALACYLTIMIAARLTGYRGVSAFGEFAGRVVTLDAIHAQHDTARCLVQDCKAHYAIAAVARQAG